MLATDDFPPPSEGEDVRLEEGETFLSPSDLEGERSSYGLKEIL
jgi:hypothetical protein